MLFLLRKNSIIAKNIIKVIITKFLLPTLLSWCIIHIFFGIFVSLTLFGEILSIWHTLFLTVALLATQYSVRSIELLFERLFPKKPKKAKIIKTVRCVEDGKNKNQNGKGKSKIKTKAKKSSKKNNKKESSYKSRKRK
jgi:hypothetical protein